METSAADNQEDAWLRRHDKFLQKLQAIVKNECDGSRMSSTKWKEMFDALFLLRQQISFDCRVKLIDEDKAKDWWGGLPAYTTHDRPDRGQTIWIEPSGGPVPCIAIEWIEIKPTGLTKTDAYWTKMPGGYQNQIERQLDALNVPYTVEGNIIRVTGHVRRSAPPLTTKSR